MAGELLIDQVSGAMEFLEPAGIGPQGPRGLPGTQGPPGIGGGSTLMLTSAAPLAAYRALAVDAAGKAIYADAATLSHGLIHLGIGLTTVLADELVGVATNEVVDNPAWSFDVGPVLLGLNGVLVQELPVSAVFSKVVGWALSPTRLLVHQQSAIYL